MLQNVKFHEATKQTNEGLAPFCYPEAIRKLFDKKRDTDRLFCMTFKSNAHKASPMFMEWAKNWPAAHRNLERMYNGMEPGYRVTVWFCIPTMDTDRHRYEFITPFADAAKDHTPALHQYLYDNDQPYIHEDLATVAEIGNGMYKRYPKIKSTGKLSSRTGTVGYHTLPSRVTWNSIRSFHVMHDIPIIRDMVYCKGLHIGLEADWHRVFLQRLPALKVGNEALHPSEKMKNTCLAGICLTPDANGVKEAVHEPSETIIVEFSNADTKTRKPHGRMESELCYGQVSNFGGKAFQENT